MVSSNFFVVVEKETILERKIVGVNLSRRGMRLSHCTVLYYIVLYGTVGDLEEVINVT